jgi:molecular chaperone GrpE
MTSFFSRRSEDEQETTPGDPDSNPPIPLQAEESAVEADLREKLLRTLAELENFRRRSVRDQEMARRREREEILRAFVGVLDTFDIALNSKGAEGNQWLEGFNAIREQMLSTVAQFGARPMDALGTAFDPHQHEAVAMAHVADAGEGQIVEVVQTGYAFEDGTVLRPAKVIVNSARSHG